MRNTKSNEGPTLETLNFTIHIGSTPTFLYLDLYLNTAYAAHSLISKIGLDRATHCCDKPILKPIGGHFEKTTQSSVFVSKS